jgi:hypothetical protein
VTDPPVPRRLGLDIPEGWRVGHSSGPPLFVTRALVTRPDGTEIDWSSRRHRKHLAPVVAVRHRGWQRPRVAGASRSSWWMGGLFMIGSFCFGLGSLPVFFDHVDGEVVAWVFFVGSIFFTTAAYLQYRECVAAPSTIDPSGPRPHGLGAFLGYRPHSLGWWATTVQLAGTVLFNVSTFAATRDALTLDQERRLIWAPDTGGSICFLIASWLAYVEVAPRLWHRPRGDLGWEIAALNLVGSVAFGLAAIGARYLTTTGEPANITLVNLGTFVGAVCFFLGALLLPVESASDGTDRTPAPASSSAGNSGTRSA